MNNPYWLVTLLHSRFYKLGSAWASAAYHPTPLLFEVRDGMLKYVHFGHRHIWVGDSEKHAWRVCKALFPQHFSEKIKNTTINEQVEI